MDALFEAKARFENEYVLYNIYRVSADQYKAILIDDKTQTVASNAPHELTMTKGKGEWHFDNTTFNDLAATLATEVDVFNNGYGALLGRIGNT